MGFPCKNLSLMSKIDSLYIWAKLHLSWQRKDFAHATVKTSVKKNFDKKLKQNSTLKAHVTPGQKRLTASSGKSE